VRYFDVLSVCLSVHFVSMMPSRKINILLAHGILRYTLCPYASLGILKLVQQRLFVGLVVFVDDDLGLFVPFCHWNGPSAEDRYATDALLGEHVMQDGCAHQAGCACEYEMHCSCELGQVLVGLTFSSDEQSSSGCFAIILDLLRRRVSASMVVSQFEQGVIRSNDNDAICACETFVSASFEVSQSVEIRW
jgi:hypothetical protein